jgi:hypothetical protein
MLVMWPGTQEDLREIKVQPAQQSQVGNSIMSIELDAEYLWLWSRSLKLNDVTVAMMGVVPLWPHVASVWALIGEEALSYPVSLTRHTRAIIEKGRSMLELRRMEMTVDTRHHAALRWATKSLGFKREGGVAHGYGLNGEDVWRLERIWK